MKLTSSDLMIDMEGSRHSYQLSAVIHQLSAGVVECSVLLSIHSVHSLSRLV